MTNRAIPAATLAASLALILATGAAAQQSSGRSDTMCPEVAETAQERACQLGLNRLSEESLATTWRRVFAEFGGSASRSGRTLLDSQRAWIAFKDKACSIYFLPGLSALEWSNGQRCRRAIIDDRISELMRISEDFPGQD